jgi:predicted TIM-barrel fold metal-dependent hydrolase
MKRIFALTVLATAALAPAVLSQTPVADHHAHLLSPASVKLIANPPLPAVELPADLARLLQQREKGWNDKAALAPLFTEDSLVLNDREPLWIRGRDEVADFLSTNFAKAYHIIPIAYAMNGSNGTMATVAGYFTRPLDNGTTRYFGQVLMTVQKGADGTWRIAAESPTFPGPTTREPRSADQLIAELDAAGIQRATVLSVAYWFGNPEMYKGPDEYANVRAENDWTAKEAARFPDRLVAFCSFNPLRDYALEEIDRCAKIPQVKGLKLHAGNSRVDMLNPEHVEKLRRVFARANERRLGIAIHLWTGPDYGRNQAEAFLSQVLPAAPDIPVQIAHFAGGGPGYTDEALEVYADAITANDPRTKHLFFDVATVADQQTEEVLKTFAKRIRQVGLQRVLFGTDLGPPAARQSWLTFRTTVPLTDEEFKTIAGNVAPYFR